MEVNSETGLELMLAVYVLIVCDGAGVYCIQVCMSFLRYLSILIGFYENRVSQKLAAHNASGLSLPP